ncbi:hypothetical protein BpHYR1_009030 [Brachionus plicatilis]|uniref:Uncharacterized protein n=1 Tax=Brachionus plicatilis TaxID=10195 RepID=A0A3M7R3R6_BRAPC|nr:hypothetical protein BpHYR1_009030 [Brachionus plicatilis]
MVFENFLNFLTREKVVNFISLIATCFDSKKIHRCCMHRTNFELIKTNGSTDNKFHKRERFEINFKRSKYKLA